MAMIASNADKDAPFSAQYSKSTIGSWFTMGEM